MPVKMPFVDDVGTGAIRLIGLLKVLWAIGVVLPWGLGVARWLMPPAALGLALTMVDASIVHIRRNEPVVVNAALFAPTVFVGAGVALAQRETTRHGRGRRADANCMR